MLTQIFCTSKQKLYIFWLHYSEFIVSSSTITCEAHMMDPVLYGLQIIVQMKINNYLFI